MTSQEALIGTRVSIREDYRLAHLRGRKGKIAARWGDPNYVALDVLLDDGHSELFWHHELEEIEEIEEAS
jgi:hypothetical protein